MSRVQMSLGWGLVGMAMVMALAGCEAPVTELSPGNGPTTAPSVASTAAPATPTVATVKPGSGPTAAPTAAPATPLVATALASSGPVGVSATGATPAAGIVAVSTPLPGEALVVTLEDSGKTLTLAIDGTFLLKLGEGYDWDIQVSDPGVVSRVMNIAVIRGAQGVYRANAAGHATLTASGNPACRQSTPPCAMPSRLFTIEILVK